MGWGGGGRDRFRATRLSLKTIGAIASKERGVGEAAADKSKVVAVAVVV